MIDISKKPLENNGIEVLAEGTGTLSSIKRQIEKKIGHEKLRVITNK